MPGQKRLSMRLWWCFLLAVAWLAACSAGKAVPSPTPTAQPALPHSMKGYELYSWQEEGLWRFTLITGTNRIKTLEEITSGEDEISADGWVKIRVEGAEALQDVLGRLPAGEEVFWNGGQGIEGGSLSLPPQDIMNEIKEHSEQLKLVFHVGN